MDSLLTKAEHHAIKIRAAINEARAAGVNVQLDWNEDEDGMHVSLFTSVHKRNAEDLRMDWVEGPFIVEGY